MSNLLALIAIFAIGFHLLYQSKNSFYYCHELIY